MITNYLSPVSFVLSIERLPNVEFYTQRATIPSISNTPVLQANPLHNIYTNSDRLEFGDLDVSFIIDENMYNYNEIFEWMKGFGTPNSSDQYAKLEKSEEGLVSDISLIVQNSSRNGNILFTFTNCFPTSLSSVNLDVTSSDIIYPEATVTFRYDHMKFEKIG